MCAAALHAWSPVQACPVCLLFQGSCVLGMTEVSCGQLAVPAKKKISIQ